MPTKLYLHDAANDQAGTYPSAEQSASTADVTWSGAITLRKMNTTIGTAQAIGSGSTLGQTAAQKHFLRFFTSRPLAGMQTVGGGTARLNVADEETNTNADFWVDGVHVYVWRPSTGTKVGTLIDTTDGAGGVEPSAANSKQVTRFTFATTAVAAAHGDVVICEIWATFSQAMALSYTVSAYYDGTTENDTENAVITSHASLLELAETLSFQEPAAPIEWLNVRDFGATGDGTTDDADAIQSALDFIYNTPSNPKRTVYIPPANAVAVSGPAGKPGQGLGYILSHPLWLRRTGTRLVGSYQNVNENFAPSSYLYPTYSYGPTIIVDAGKRSLDLVTSLVSGPGNALRRQNSWANEANQSFHLRDAATLDIDGLTAFTVEFWWKGTVGDGSFIFSSGVWLLSDRAVVETDNSCFVIGITNSRPYVTVRTVAGKTTITDTTGALVNDNVAHHFAFDYDGTTLRVYVDGVVRASAAVTGTLKQHPAEEVNLGAWHTIQPFSSLYGTSLLGTYDGIRISNVARYAGAFVVPTAKFTSDANTLVLMNFDLQIGPMTRAYTNNGDFWAYYYGPAQPGAVGGDLSTEDYLTQPNGWNIEGIAIRGGMTTGGGPRAAVEPWGTGEGMNSGIIAADGAYNGLIRRCSLEQMRVGLQVGYQGNAYGMRAEQLTIRARKGRYAYRGTGTSGLAQFEDCWFFGGAVGVYSRLAGINFSRCFWELGSDCVFGALMRQDDITSPPNVLVGCTFSSEGGLTTALLHTGLITVTVVAAAKTFTRTAGSYLADGFAAGMSITMRGFTNAGNNTIKTIQSVTATVITVADGSGLVDETGNGDEYIRRADEDRFLALVALDGGVASGRQANILLALGSSFQLTDSPFASCHVLVSGKATGKFDNCFFHNWDADGPADKAWRVTAVGPVFVDETTDFNSAAVGDVDPFPAVEAVGDYFAVGFKRKFTTLKFTVGTAGVGGTIAWEYWNGSAWAALTGGSTGTEQMTVAGARELTFTVPTDWTRTTLNGSEQIYYVRARVTGLYSTNPILDIGTIAGGGDVSEIVRLATGAGTAGVVAQPFVFTNCIQSEHQAMFKPWSRSRGVATAELPGLLVVPFSATPVFECAKASTFEITLTGNVTSSTLLDITEGQRVTFIIKQDATGGRTFAWPTNMIGAPAVNPGGNAVTAQTFYYDGTNAIAT